MRSINTSYSLNPSKNIYKHRRPNSASKKSNLGLFIVPNTSKVPPPIVFSMPNNPKKLSGLGNKIEREALYENNMQLKDIINKLKSELAETRNEVVIKDIELRKKEKLIKECCKENDLEEVHEQNIEKAKESTLVTFCKKKYNNLKMEYKNKCNENEILKMNIKITKMKEYQIQIDVLKKEMEKLRKLYFYTTNENKDLKIQISDLQQFKNKFIEQHNIISSYMLNYKKLNDEINSLKQENSILKLKLNKNQRQKQFFQNKNVKLKIKNDKMLNLKKIKEENVFIQKDQIEKLKKLEKDCAEYKKLCAQKDLECKKLIQSNDKFKNDFNKNNELKPFDYNKIKSIQTKNNVESTTENNKCQLYKSLLDDSRYKLSIYENYLKSNNIDTELLIKKYDYDGNLNSSKRIFSPSKSETSPSSKTDPPPVNNNLQDKLSSIDEEQELNNGEDIDNIDNTHKLLSLLHVFVKNLEASHLTKEILGEKINEILKQFLNKEQVTKEEFIRPFINMFIETMKITINSDKEIVNNFFNDFIENLQNDTSKFCDSLVEIFDNIKDYTNYNKDVEISLELNKYKKQLISKLKENDFNKNNMITFEIFGKIVAEINLVLDDENMEYLIYEMKKNVGEGHSIFDLNYEIIINLLNNDLDAISEKLRNFRINLINNKTNINNICQEYIRKIELENKSNITVLDKNKFFEFLKNFNIEVNEEMQKKIYNLFKVDIPKDKTNGVEFMEYEKLKAVLQ